ncbi:glycerate kinase type-2 family protein [Flavitalea sp.]|nr:glycerate kinase [Flavitalea sp.]
MSLQDAKEIFMAGVGSVQPARLIPGHVSLNKDLLIVGDRSFRREALGKVIIIGAGKASAAMAVAVERVLMPVISAGLIITKYGHSLPLEKIECLEAGHPVPDSNGIEATLKILSLVENLEKNDLVIFLVSGGASALMADVPPGLSTEALQDLVRLLLASGATIDEINCIRKHLSLVKGGHLAKKVFPANLVSLILSDVNGDELSVIASGPTVSDPSTFSEAIEILNKYNLAARVQPAILRFLQDGTNGLVPETPKPGDPAFGNTSNFLIGTNGVSLQAACKAATEKGYHPLILNTRLEGEAEEQAAKFVETCLLYTGTKPACLLMGGETTVTIRGKGMGGRNQHFVLAALCELIKKDVDPNQVPVILSGGTDGTDGPTDAAGAMIDAGLSNILKAAGGEDLAQKFLSANDAYHFFEKYGGLIKTGPTQTNVMDLVIGLVF